MGQKPQMHGEIYNSQEKDIIMQIFLESYQLNHTTLQAIKHTNSDPRYNFQIHIDGEKERSDH